jgi:hypothetical protein
MTAVFDGSSGRRLTLENRAGPADDVMYEARLSTEAGECSAVVWEYNSGLAAFVRALADDWRGFEGERRYATIEGQLTLTCRHDGRGTVACRFELRQPWPPGWSMSADIDFGAGAHLERIATEVEQFFGS